MKASYPDHSGDPYEAGRAPTGMSALAIVAVLLAVCWFVAWSFVGNIPANLYIPFAPYAALGCAIVATKHVQRSRGRVGGGLLASLALVLAGYQILFIGPRPFGPGANRWAQCNVATGLPLLALSVYAVWPVRGYWWPPLEWLFTFASEDRPREQDHD